jgi:UDP-glucose 4-epimerase
VGVIGLHIADSLLVRGHEVAVVDSLSTGKRENVSRQARFSEIDIRSGCEEDFEPEALSHQVAQMDVMRWIREPHFDAEVNVLGTIGLLQNCVVEHGVGNVVFGSTGGAVYGEQGEFLTTEDHPGTFSPLTRSPSSRRSASVLLTAWYTASTTLPCAPATSDGAAAL